MALEGEGAAGELAAGHAGGAFPVVRLGPVHRRLAIDLDNDVLALNLDVLREPLVILGERNLEGICLAG